MKRKIRKYYAFISIVVFNNKEVRSMLLNKDFIKKIEELGNIKIIKVLSKKIRINKKSGTEIIYFIPGNMSKAKEDLNFIIHREIRDTIAGKNAELLYHTVQEKKEMN